jgi:gliding motility-associated-like protein
VKASGGTGTLSYMILEDSIASASADSGYFPDLPAGTYTVEIKDGSDCSIDSIFTIEEPQPIVIDTAYISDTIICFGDGNGEITALVSGGTTPYIYILSGIDIDSNLYEDKDTTNSTAVFTNVPPGQFNVLVTNLNGCDTVQSDTLILTTPAPLEFDTLWVEDIACYGDLGSLTVVPTGGTSPYRVSVDSGATFVATGVLDTAIIGNLAAGDYDVFVMDTNGCSIADTTLTIQEPLSPITVDTAYYTDQLLCNADTNGYIVVKGSGGTGTITYTLNDSIPSASADSGYFNNLGANTYTVRLTDSAGCTLDTLFTINAPLAITIDTAYISQEILCYGDGSGEITAIASGGTPPYIYMLSGVDTNNTGVFTNVPPGQFNVFVTDFNGCDTLVSDTLVVTTPDSLFIDTVLAQDAICGGNDGSIYVVGNGGTRPYRVSLDGGSTFVAYGITTDTATISNQPAGTYNNITLVDTNGCSFTYASSVTINNPPAALTITSVDTVNESGCYGDGNGSIEVHATGGWGDTLTFAIDGGAFGTDSLFTGLTSGSYTLSVKDSLGCIVTQNVTLGGPEELLLTVSTVNVKGTIPGSVTLIASGGTPGPTGSEYEFWLSDTYVADPASRTWISDDTTYTFSSLAVGTYYVSIRDANGCYVDATTYVGEDVLDVTVEANNPICFGDDWSIIVTIDDGTLPIDLNLSPSPFDNQDTTYALTSSFPIVDTIVFTTSFTGNLIVHLEDDNGVAYDTIIVITEPDALSLSAPTTVSKTCPRLDLSGNYTWDGELHQTATGGTGDTLIYTLYLYNPGTSTLLALDSNYTGSFTGLGEYGSYVIGVVDSLGCETIGPDRSIPSEHTFQVALVDDTTLCKYNTIQLSAGTGNGGDDGQDIHYEWTPDTIFDDATIENPTLTMMSPVTVTMRMYDDECQYEASTDFSMFDTVGMQVKVVDGNIVPNDTSNADTIFGTIGNLGEVSLPSEYKVKLWWPEQVLDTSAFSSVYKPGYRDLLIDYYDETDHTFSFYIEDGVGPYYAIGLTYDGCLEMQTVEISMREPIVQDSIYTVFTPNGDGINDTWVIDYAYQYPDFEVQIINRWGQMVYYHKGYGENTAAEWDGTNMKNGKDLPMGTYYYIITPNDGQTKPFTGTVTIIR